MTEPNENTSGRQEAKEALAESRQSKRQARTVIDEASVQLAQMAAFRERNHFTEAFRRLLQVPADPSARN